MAFIPTIKQICQAIEEVTRANKAASTDNLKDRNFRKDNYINIKIGGETFEQYLDRCIHPKVPDIRSQ